MSDPNDVTGLIVSTGPAAPEEPRRHPKQAEYEAQALALSYGDYGDSFAILAALLAAYDEGVEAERAAGSWRDNL